MTLPRRPAEPKSKKAINLLVEQGGLLPYLPIQDHLADGVRDRIRTDVCA